MVGTREAFDGYQLLASDLALTHPFLRPGTGPLGPEEQRRAARSKAVSTAVTTLLHVLFFFFFVLAVHPFDMKSRPLIETILTLTLPGNNRPPIQKEEDTRTNGGQPGDILGAVGRSLACDAGSWEHLTSAERERCGLYPWRGMRLPNGTLVMVPRSVLPRLKEAPDTQFGINTGQDRIGADVRNGIIPGQGGCPILQNTPCMHVSPGMRSATGDN